MLTYFPGGRQINFHYKSERTSVEQETPIRPFAFRVSLCQSPGFGKHRLHLMKSLAAGQLIL